jgi:N6-L-threonylcarbamoyladenine synthase
MSLILGIESSCDETAAALVTSDRRILAHRLAGQEEEHRPYGPWSRSTISKAMRCRRC